MKNLILLSLLLFSSFVCIAQKTYTGKYIGCSFQFTKNISFINKAMMFRSPENDTILINIKLPLDTKKYNVIDKGIYYNCILQKDTTYTIRLEKICVNEIPEICNSYYKTNAVFDEKDCSKFTEFENNTPYEYMCEISKPYEKFVDIDNVLYEITDMNPHNCCFIPH